MFLFDFELATGELNVEVDSLPKPKSLEDLQLNYAAFDTMGVFVQGG